MSFFAGVFETLVPADLSLKQAFDTAVSVSMMIAILSLRPVCCFASAMADCKTDVFGMMMMWQYRKSKYNQAGQ